MTPEERKELVAGIRDYFESQKPADEPVYAGTNLSNELRDELFAIVSAKPAASLTKDDREFLRRESARFLRNR